MASVISTAATTTAATTPLASTPTVVTSKSLPNKAEKKKAKKERKDKLEKKKGKKRERETKRDYSESCSSDEGKEEKEKDIILVDEDDELDDMLAKSPKNVEEEVQELLNGEEREKVIAMAKEREKAERKLRQKTKQEFKKMTSEDDKKLQALFLRQEALAKSSEVALLKQLKTQKADLERRILAQEDKSDVVSLRKVEKDIKAQRLQMREKFSTIAKEKGIRYAVPNGIRKERAANNKKPDSCIICCNEERNCAFDPCGHQNTCYGCSQRLNECPICRVRIVKKLKLFKN